MKTAPEHVEGSSIFVCIASGACSNHRQHHFCQRLNGLIVDSVNLEIGLIVFAGGAKLGWLFPNM